MEKLILFDLDGTLMNTKEGITKCAAYALKKYGIVVEDTDTLDFFIGPPLHLSFQQFYGFGEKQAEEAVRWYRERYQEIGIFECEAYTGVIEVLQQLKTAGFSMGVATSKPEVFAERIVEKFGMACYFEHVAGSLLDNSRSDKKEVLEEAFRRFEVGRKFQKEDVIMVGDRKHDIIGAKKMGILSVGVTYGFAKGDELEQAGADYIAERPQDLIEIIKDWEMR